MMSDTPSDHRQAVALFRYGLIADLAQLPPGTKGLYDLIRAKAAMFAGYQTLLEAGGMEFSGLDRIVLAGNFGAQIDLERVIAIGLLPDVDRTRFHYLGNAALLGCQISLTDQLRFRERVQIRKLMTNIELSDNQRFTDYYMAALFLPHTDTSLFQTGRSGN